MSTQSNLSLESKPTGPVECLGQKFPSDDARREHYLALLAEKLKDPEFRKIEGFPIGEDEDILALSDPPYYTACPNPWIGEFIEHYGRPYDSKEKYHREPFAADVSEGKYHPIYKYHPYPTKVPHRAIMRYILHYTEPGDVVFDGFCGTGMTGVAAQLCGDRKEVQELGFRIDNQGSLFDESGKNVSKIGSRLAVLNDLSPAATFIANNYNRPLDVTNFEREAERILSKIEDEFGWMYETKHSDGSLGRIDYTVWSDVFACPECADEIVFWKEAVNQNSGKVKDSFHCPNCQAELTKRKLKRAWETKFDSDLKVTVRQSKQIPVLISYTSDKKRFEKLPSDDDLKLIEKIDSIQVHEWIPIYELPNGDKTSEPKRMGITHAHHFYSKRNLQILAALRERIPSSIYKILITKVSFQITKLYRFTYQGGCWGAGGGPLSGTLYIPSLVKELNIIKQLRSAIKSRRKLNSSTSAGYYVGSTASSTDLSRLPSNSIDYIFIDPPFGSNLNYSELSFLWESWLQVSTATEKEAIQSKFQKKQLDDYRYLIFTCLSEAYRVLKPGRWVTIEFSNTAASVWNSILSSLQEAGFIVANVAALDKKKGSFNVATSTTAVKQDLVISAYKPNGGLEDRFRKTGHTVEGVWDFMQTHLRNLPVVKPRGGEMEYIAERDPRILYDRMIAFYIGHGIPVPLSSAEFQAALAEKFPEREGMFFLAEQVAEWDKKRVQMQGVGQMSIFVEDEKSAIDWLRNFLKTRPSTYQDIHPEFMQQLGASWKKFETRPELRLLLEQNFLEYTGQGEVPSQIHSYLSTQNKDLRNLPKDDARLKVRAKDRWFVPDSAKAVDVEAIRNKRLMQEFWELCDASGISKPSPNNPNQPSLPLAIPASPKKTGRKKLKEVRTEAVRLGFKECFAAKDYATILSLSATLPANVIEEDEQLQMIHDMAEMRAEG